MTCQWLIMLTLTKSHPHNIGGEHDFLIEHSTFVFKITKPGHKSQRQSLQERRTLSRRLLKSIDNYLIFLHLGGNQCQSQKKFWFKLFKIWKNRVIRMLKMINVLLLQRYLISPFVSNGKSYQSALSEGDIYPINAYRILESRLRKLLRIIVNKIVSVDIYSYCNTKSKANISLYFV